MIIGLRAGHSDNCTGAIGIVDEHEQMKKYYVAVKAVFEKYGILLLIAIVMQILNLVNS
jgi:N-acetylmuramoyl-L-alanine amidase